jgi:hypothetical protein
VRRRRTSHVYKISSATPAVITMYIANYSRISATPVRWFSQCAGQTTPHTPRQQVCRRLEVCFVRKQEEPVCHLTVRCMRCNLKCYPTIYETKNAEHFQIHELAMSHDMKLKRHRQHMFYYWQDSSQPKRVILETVSREIVREKKSGDEILSSAV